MIARQAQRASFSLMVPIVGVAAWLRLWNLTSRGLIYWDEGKFCLEGLRILAGLEALGGMHTTLAAGKAVGTAKPTHALLIAVSYIVLGVHDYSPLIFDALSSAVTVIIVYALSRRILGVGTALVAAALLAVSGYDTVYARSALSESDANLLFVLAVLFLVQSWQQDATGRWSPREGGTYWRAASALCMGLAFTTNYRELVYIAIVVAFDLLLLVRRRASPVAPALIWAAGLSVFPALWEIAGLVAQAHGYILFRSEVTYRPTSYLAEAIYQIHQGRQSVLQFSPVLYLRWYVVRQGWPAALLLLYGLALTVVRRNTSLVLPACLVALPYCVYVFAPFVVPRNLDTAVPFAAILAAAAIVSLSAHVGRSYRTHRVAAISLLLLVSFVGATFSWRLSGVRSGFAQAARYLTQHRGDDFLVRSEVMLFYMRDSPTTCDAIPLPKRPNGLAARAGSHQAYAETDGRPGSTERYLARHAHRTARFLLIGTTSLGEDLASSENGTAPGAGGQDYVSIYSLTLPGRSSRSESGATCRLEHLA